MEWVNQELEEYLQIFVRGRQDNWYTLLPLAEFSYNNHIHSSMQQTPFLFIKLLGEFHSIIGAIAFLCWEHFIELLGLFHSMVGAISFLCWEHFIELLGHFIRLLGDISLNY